MDRNEQKRKRTAMYLSLGIHGLLLLLFLFVIAWREPDPPIPEYGIELNFGTSTVGSGPVQPTQEPVTDEVVEEESAPVEESVEEVTEPAEEVIEEVQEEAATEEATAVTEDINSPDQVEATQSENMPAMDEVKEPAEQPTEEAEPVTETPTPTIDEGSLMKPQSGQGDDNDEVGDKGDPEGIDEQALYKGAKGSGGGASLNMAGWDFENDPEPDDRSSETGEIIFEIEINDDGIVERVTPKKYTVTPEVLKVYRDAVWELTFRKTDNQMAAKTSSGTITFILKDK